MVFDWFKRTQAQVEPEPEAQPALEAEPEPAAETLVAPVDPVAEPVAAPAAPAGAGVDEDALAWARQAYARLKAQQEAASPVAAAETEPPPASEPAAPPAGPGLSLLEQAAAQRQQRLQEITAPAEPEQAFAAATPPADAADPSLGAFDATFTWSAEVLAAQGRRVEEVSLEEIDWLGRLRRGLEKTRKGFVTQLLENLGDDPLTPAVLDDLESTLLRADVGVKATDQVL